MISIDEAEKRLRAAIRPLGPENIPLDGTLGRVLATDLAAAWDLPIYDNAAMDGFALRSADVSRTTAQAPTRLEIVGKVYAGDRSDQRVGPGGAVLVTTGAAVPEGADAVVRQEAVDVDERSITVHGPVAPGANVRRCGEAARKGQVLLRRGTSIGPDEIAVLATLGMHQVLVGKRPRVRVVPTGDELQAVEQAGPDRPVDSNRPMVRALAEQAGALVEHTPIVRDNTDALADALGEAAADADLIITIGGASVGERDLVRLTLARIGARELFWGVAIRPGKPVGSAHLQEALVLALPGNPTACRTVFWLLARPTIAALQGTPWKARAHARAVLQKTLSRKSGLTSFVRGVAVLTSAGLHVSPAPHHRSSQVLSWLGTNALLVVPPGDGPLASGDMVEVELDGPLAVEQGTSTRTEPRPGTERRT
jgi:molybdopterin molybdotransferase